MSYWNSTKLSDIAEVIDSLHQTPNYTEDSNGYSMVRVTDINSRELDLTKTKKVSLETYLEFSKKHKSKIGDIVFSRVGSYGRSSIVVTDQEFCLGQNTVFIIPQIDSYYLYYYLNSPSAKEQINSLVAGTTQPTVSLKSLKSIVVPVPPVNEQKRIVAILDQAFADIDQARATAETNLKNARDLFDSYLQQVFSQRGDGWIEKKFSECFSLKSGDGLTSKDMVEGPFSVYGGNGVAGKHNDFNLSEESVIIGRVGALCGNARHIVEKIWLTDNAFKVQDFKFDFNLHFLTYLLNFKNLRSFARQAAQPVISNSSLSEVALNFPKCIKLQSELASNISVLNEQVDILSKLYTSKIKALDELKKSILHKAFIGELTKSKGIAA